MQQKNGSDTIMKVEVVGELVDDREDEGRKVGVQDQGAEVALRLDLNGDSVHFIHPY